MPDDADLLSRCAALDSIALTDTSLACQLAPSLIREAEHLGRHDLSARLYFSLGLAQRGRQELRGAVTSFDACLRDARELGDVRLAVRALMSRSATHLYAGHAELAFVDLAEAERIAPADLSGRLVLQRAALLHKLGRFSEADEAYASALDRINDPASSERGIALGNRALLQTQRGEFAAAAVDLDRAEAIHRRHRDTPLLADVIHNRAYLAACLGDVPAAVAGYREASELRENAGLPLGVDLIDLGLLWLSVGLAREALDLAARVEEDLRRRGMRVELGDAVLLRARAEMMLGDFVTATESAEEARALFAEEERQGWGATAGLVACMARFEHGERTCDLLEAASTVAADLRQVGWFAAVGECQLLQGRVALALGEAEQAAHAFARAAADRRSPIPELRLHAWLALCLWRAATGDRRGAFGAASACLRELHVQRHRLGAQDLRSGLSQRGRLLEDVVLGLVHDARPEQVLSWAERLRSGALPLPRIRPVAQVELRDLFAELRVATMAADDAAREGDLEAYVRWSRARTRVARRLRTAIHSQRGEEAAIPPRVDRRSLVAGLGRHELVEYIRCGTELIAVTWRANRLHRLGLGDHASIADLAARLQLAVRSVVAGCEPDREVSRLAAELDDRVLAPLRCGGPNPLVIVPTGSLWSVPWGVLPSLVDTPITVCPSAGHLLAADSSGTSATVSSAVLLAGPRLDHAEREVRSCARWYTSSTVLTGADASPALLLAAMGHADVVHLACHGVFERDHPWFSTLLLHDGPMTAHELQLLPRAPALVVLAACEVGDASGAVGDQPLGFVASLLAAGTRSLVASTLPVRDDQSPEVMSRFHRLVAGGHDASAALAEVRAESAHDAAVWLTAASFSRFGVPNTAA